MPILSKICGSSLMLSSRIIPFVRYYFLTHPEYVRSCFLFCFTGGHHSRRVPSYINDHVMKLHLIQCKASSCSFQFYFVMIILLSIRSPLRVCSWWFIKDFNLFSKCSVKILVGGAQVFFFLHFEVQFFLPYHLRWCYAILDNFPSCFKVHKWLRMRYLNPSFSLRPGDPL